MDTQTNRRGFWKKVNRGGLIMLLLAVAAIIFIVAMAVEESRIDKIAAKAIDKYNETQLTAEIDSGKSGNKRDYYEYDVSYESLDRITVTVQYLGKYNMVTDYFELKRSGGSWEVVFGKYGSPDDSYAYETGIFSQVLGG